MKKSRKHYSPAKKVAVLRRHLLEKEPISKLYHVGAPYDKDLRDHPRPAGTAGVLAVRAPAQRRIIGMTRLQAAARRESIAPEESDSSRSPAPVAAMQSGRRRVRG